TVPSGRGGRLDFRLAPPIAEELAELGRRRGATLIIVLLAGLQALLRRLTGEDQPVLATPVAGRGRAETEGLVGCFVNTLVLRGDASGRPSFAGLLERARETALFAYAHQDLPFERLVEELRPGRDLSHTPLFQVMLALQNAPAAGPGPEGLKVRPAVVELATAKFDLSLSFEAGPDGLAGRAAFPTDLFDATTVARWLRGLGNLLAAAADEPGLPAADLPILAPGERQQLLAEWTDGPVGSPVPAPERVLARAAERPDAVAVAGEGWSLSYGEIERRSGALAGALRARGVGPAVRAALLLERAAELAVALLAVARAGGAAVFLDPGDPAERVAFQIADSGAALVLGGAGGFPSGEAEGIDAPADPGSLAYVVYTSGSTGRPKGVAVSHGALAAHLAAMDGALPLGPDDAVLHKTPTSFDPAVWELWAPLAAGARLVMAEPGGHRDPAYLARALAAQRATVARVVPALLEALAAEPGLPACRGLRRLLCGGEALPPAAGAAFLGRTAAELWNSYGPAEGTVTATLHRVAGPAHRVPLGRAVGPVVARVLDRGLAPAPVGAAGELALAGPTLARGYLGRP
ncbi:MAG TPA: AMP-binding protein, partial [Thermoanaerobaculia bacterium]|nr:AMP-binding protein [Thermoanaerobaculia bacterium]